MRLQMFIGVLCLAFLFVNAEHETTTVSEHEKDVLTTEETTSKSSNQHDKPKIAITQKAETTTAASSENSTTSSPGSNCTTLEPETCGKIGQMCMDNDECCDELKCNFISCAKCISSRNACEDDDDCCKGLSCVQVAPVDNNNFFGKFFPIANKFNPTKQCTKVGKKKFRKTPNGPGGMGTGGFDWGQFVPFKGKN